MKPNEFLQSIANLSDAAACVALAKRVHLLCEPGVPFLFVGRSYNLHGEVQPYVASVSDAHGSGPAGRGASERAALEALVRELTDSRIPPIPPID